MVFSTDLELLYVQMYNKSEKVHGFFGWGWKNQRHTVIRPMTTSSLTLCYLALETTISNIAEMKKDLSIYTMNWKTGPTT